MTGLFSFLKLQLTAEWLHEWLKAFFTAWPRVRYRARGFSL
nr:MULTISPECIES: DUF2798 domain-containing protein [unclassified Rhizobium]